MRTDVRLPATDDQIIDSFDIIIRATNIVDLICFSELKHILTSNAAPQQTLVCPPVKSQSPMGHNWVLPTVASVAVSYLN